MQLLGIVAAGEFGCSAKGSKASGLARTSDLRRIDPMEISR
jgi:hypothetical protein